MEIKMVGRRMPRDAQGVVKFNLLAGSSLTLCGNLILKNEQSAGDSEVLLNVFTPLEVVELVNRAIYHMEYQKEGHKKRQQRLRDEAARIEGELRRAGVDVEAVKIKKELEGK